MNDLYANIGKKIKTLAAVSFAVLSVCAFIAGLILFFIEPDDYWWGLLISFIGPFVLLLLSYPLYGFGELVDKKVLQNLWNI